MGWLRNYRLFRRRRYHAPRSLRRRALIGVAKISGALLLLSALFTFSLRWVDPPTSAFMLREESIARSQGRAHYRLRHYWLDWEHIAPHAKIAVVAAEDQRFPEHPGFDLDAISEAVHERINRGRRRGASTISQQVAKNLFLWPGESLLRKGLEAYFTVLIESCWSKQRVLEVYLNIAQFGKGVFGIEAASLAYFHKSGADLTPREAATLAAVLPNPVRLRADRPSPYLQSRIQWILQQMDMLGGATYVMALPE